MSGKHVYSLTRDQFDLNGHIVIEAETFQNESDLGMYIDESLDGWFYGWCSFGANNYNWNGYKNAGFAYRKNYSALVIDLQKDDRISQNVFTSNYFAYFSFIFCHFI